VADHLTGVVLDAADERGPAPAQDGQPQRVQSRAGDHTAVVAKLALRVDPAATSFGSASDLASAMRRAEAAHGEHEKRTGAVDPDWPDWYARYMVAEQAGTELPA